MTLTVEWDPRIRSMGDSIEKFFPEVGATLAAPITAPLRAGAAVVGAVGSAAGQAASALGDAAKEKLGQKEKEMAQAEEEVARAEKQQEVQPTGQAPPQPDPTTASPPPEATTGSAIQGMKGNEKAGIPTDQPGTETTAPPTLKSYFMSTFGIEGGELINLLEKGGEGDILPQVVELLRQEQKTILKQFDWWDEHDWDLLQLQDNDYNLLIMYPDRLELPLRSTLAAVKRSDGSDLDTIWKSWHNRLDAENRLSRRERTILSECHNTIRKHGDMNAQTLTSYGINATTQELASLIKSYGFMFDVKVVGKGKKSDDRTLYYGSTKPPIFLKKIDSFIGNLWEVDGSLDITKMGTPRLFLPFTTKRAADYTIVLKAELGVEGIVREGEQFVIEGDFAVKKAAIAALPFLHEKRQEACLILAALDGDHNAGRILSFNKASSKEQGLMLKSWNVPEEKLNEWAKVIVDGF